MIVSFNEYHWSQNFRDITEEIKLESFSLAEVAKHPQIHLITRIIRRNVYRERVDLRSNTSLMQDKCKDAWPNEKLKWKTTHATTGPD